MKNHIVNTVSFNLPAQNYEKARQQQTAAKQWATYTFPLLLESAFNDLTHDEDIVLVERLEIDLKDFPWNLTDIEWKNKILQQLQLAKKGSNAFEIIFKEWLFYFKNGAFQRDSIFKSIGDYEKYILKNIKQFTENETNKIRTTFANIDVVNRFLFGSSINFSTTIFGYIFKIEPEKAEKLLIFFRKTIKKQSELVIEIFKQFEQLSHKNQVKEKLNLIELILKKQDFKKEDIVKSFAKVNSFESPVPTLQTEAFLDCKNAGLVLLFPFLASFFKNIGLVKEQEFINEKAKSLAVQTLFYLAKGKILGDEDEYFLPKIICGMAPNSFIKTRKTLPKLIKNEANDLLKSVIEHWSVLQNTSPDGLRASFLVRNGKLKMEPDQIIIKMEESGVDILLNKITWGFRNFRLPWMQVTIITEWF